MDIPALQSTQAAVPPPPAYRDRSTGLKIFGVLQIILGTIAALAMPMALLSLGLGRKSDAAPGAITYVVVLCIYATLAIANITLGIGSIRARRWARALTLIMSWYWVITGALITIVLTAILLVVERGRHHPTSASAPSAAVMAVVITFFIVLFAAFLIGLPSLFVWFYRKKDVEETCRHRDPVERWTDRCPLPVLAASTLFAFGAFYFVIFSFAIPLVPFFGRYLTGPAGLAGMLALAGLDAYLAFSLFHLRIIGWRIAIASMFLRVVSAAITFGHADRFQAYAKMGWSDARIQAMRASPIIRSHVILWWGLGYAVALLVYLLGLKRYFRAPAEAQPSYQMPSA